MQFTLCLLISLLLNACVSIPTMDSLRSPAETSSAENLSVLPTPFEIYLPYVGQGDATLIRSSNGKTLLIDAGPPSAGREHILPLLEKLGMTRLDGILITHYDLDHLGGVPDLIAGRDSQIGTEDDIVVGTFYDRGGQPWDSSPGYDAYLGVIEQKGFSRQSLQPGESIDLDPSLNIRVMAVNARVWNMGEIKAVDLSPSTYSQKENASSIALLIETESFRYLTAGDLTGGGSVDGFLTPDLETLLADAVGPVDALHVNHHGSLTSSNEYFVEMSSPENVFIQAGKDNPYGHPKQEVVGRWNGMGAEIYSTVENEVYHLTVLGVEMGLEVMR